MFDAEETRGQCRISGTLSIVAGCLDLESSRLLLPGRAAARALPCWVWSSTLLSSILASDQVRNGAW